MKMFKFVTENCVYSFPNTVCSTSAIVFYLLSYLDIFCHVTFDRIDYLALTAPT